ncbi:MAG TPA: ribonuclease Z [Thermoanaerobaculia bacterium]|jgi:ribonuclease Z|nr:ribonuclease Z [Thermoanaerobaculia bacterium]
MELTFLGTGSAMPTRQRSMSAVALRLPERREVWLFDCGEGTQHQLLRTPLRPPQIRRIFLTHLHGDHLYGLPGLLTTLSMLGVETAVDLYGPVGLAEVVEVTLRAAHAGCTYALNVHELAPGLVLDEGEAEGALRVRCLSLAHGVPCFGFRIEEAPRAGRLDAARAAELGVVSGPDLGTLKRGGSVVVEGREVKSADVVAPAVAGRVLAICGDTLPCDAAVELARGADLLVHEATFGQSRQAMAAERRHSTAAQAADVARRAGVARLVITHFSARYQQSSGETVDDLLLEARAVFPTTDAAHDLMTVAIPRRAPTE